MKQLPFTVGFSGFSESTFKKFQPMSRPSIYSIRFVVLLIVLGKFAYCISVFNKIHRNYSLCIKILLSILLNTEIEKRIKTVPTNFEISEEKTITFEVTKNGGCYIVMNCNRDLFAMLNVSLSTPELNKINIILNKQNIELNMSIQERIVTITASSALWGQSLVIGYNL